MNKNAGANRPLLPHFGQIFVDGQPVIIRMDEMAPQVLELVHCLWLGSIHHENMLLRPVCILHSHTLWTQGLSTPTQCSVGMAMAFGFSHHKHSTLLAAWQGTLLNDKR